jgi:iron complex transport system substrate-binding protein
MRIKTIMTRTLLAVCLACFSLLLVPGCASGNSGGGQSAADSSQLAADSSQPKTASTATSYPLTINNYDFDGTAYSDADVVFEQAPQRAFAATQGAAETLLMLGLEDSIAGTANKTSEPVAAIASAYNKLNLVTAEYAAKEQVLACDPDIIIGRGMLFTNATYGVGTPTELKQMGIAPWILSSSTNGSKMDNIYSDIRALGKVFDVQEKADAWANELEGRMSELYAKAEAAGIANEQQTYLFLVQARSGNGYMILSGPQASQQEDALQHFGLSNASTEVRMEAVSAENILAFDPDIILAINYTPGDTSSTQAMIDDVKGNESLATLPAVANDAFYIIDYNDIFSFSFRMVDGIEELLQSMYPKTFK